MCPDDERAAATDPAVAPWLLLSEAEGPGAGRITVRGEYTPDLPERLLAHLDGLIERGLTWITIDVSGLDDPAAAMPAVLGDAQRRTTAHRGLVTAVGTRRLATPA